MVARGYVGASEDLEALQARLRGSGVEIQVEFAPWPQCEAMSVLHGALQAPDGPGIKILQPGREPRKGETLMVELTAPRAPSHVHLAYVQADGRVAHLVQSDASHLRTLDNGQRVLFGDGKEGRTAFVVAPPFGREMLIAVASRAPLFAAPRPQHEDVGPFLAALAREVRERSGNAERSVRAAVLTLITREN